MFIDLYSEKNLQHVVAGPKVIYILKKGVEVYYRLTMLKNRYKLITAILQFRKRLIYNLDQLYTFPLKHIDTVWLTT